jgi:hypothetical protein
LACPNQPRIDGGTRHTPTILDGRSRYICAISSCRATRVHSAQEIPFFDTRIVTTRDRKGSGVVFDRRNGTYCVLLLTKTTPDPGGAKNAPAIFGPLQRSYRSNSSVRFCNSWCLLGRVICDVVVERSSSHASHSIQKGDGRDSVAAVDTVLGNPSALGGTFPEVDPKI